MDSSFYPTLLKKCMKWSFDPFLCLRVYTKQSCIAIVMSFKIMKLCLFLLCSNDMMIVHTPASQWTMCVCMCTWVLSFSPAAYHDLTFRHIMDDDLQWGISSSRWPEKGVKKCVSNIRVFIFIFFNDHSWFCYHDNCDLFRLCLLFYCLKIECWVCWWRVCCRDRWRRF